MWTTLDIGVKFDKPTNIRAQLAALDNSHTRQPSDTKTPLSSYSSIDEQGSFSDDKASTAELPDGPVAAEHDARFAALKSFYRTQLSETSASPNDPFMGSDLGSFYSSPSALSRIMSLYTAGIGKGSGKKSKSKPSPMREALTPAEGLHVFSPDDEEPIIQKMASDECGWDGMASLEQRSYHTPGARFVDDLRPLPILLRTKRSKRCKACKHILVKPEFKPQSTRFRIRLIALSYIPLTLIRPLIPFSPTVAPPINMDSLDPMRPVQFLLTLKNHMFDPIRVTLATPSITPGRVSSKVTMLCPQFEVGANSDVWDEALSGAPDARSSRSGPEKVAEAGKVWEKGRNWTTVVMEIVPGSLSELKNNGGLKNDEDVLEVPVFVRVEWETESGGEDLPIRASSKRQEVDMVKRELAYWIVVGVGRIKNQ